MSSFRPPGNNQHLAAESVPAVADEGALTSTTTVATNHNSTVANNRININQVANNLDRCLFMSTTTWARDSHELFDYEARHVHKKSCELKRAAKVFRTTLDIQIILEGQALPTQAADFLLSIRERDGNFSVHPADRNIQLFQGAPTLMPKKLWLIVKHLPTSNHQLQESDVIKLGRFKLRVKQLVKSGAALPELRLDDVETPYSTVTPEEASSMQCRICLLEGGTRDDPLLCPCLCKGSIKFVHLECLRRWINGRLQLNDDPSKASYFFKQLHCELCKAAFPSSVFLNGERFHIVNFPKVDPPFIILENIVGAANKGLHIVSMNSKKELKLGRGHESDVRIADVSISRYHATIRFSDGEFILEDHHSKFGTLVGLRKIQLVEETHPLAVQVGRTVLFLAIRKPTCQFEDINDVVDDMQGQTPKTDPEDEASSRGPPPASVDGNTNNAVNHNIGTGMVSNNHGLQHGNNSTTVRGMLEQQQRCTSNSHDDGISLYYQTMRLPSTPYYDTLRLQQLWGGVGAASTSPPQIYNQGMRALPSLMMSSLPDFEQQVAENVHNNNERRNLHEVQSMRRERSRSSECSDNETSSAAAGPLLKQLIAYRTDLHNNNQNTSIMTDDGDDNNESTFSHTNLSVSRGVDCYKVS